MSLQWALRWYGLIPEQVFLVTSMTTKHTREFSTPIGNFSYRQVPTKYFSIGVRNLEENGYYSLIATPEKALCDTMVYYDRFVPNQSLVRLEEYLEEDMRFDTDALKDFDISIIESCAQMGKKENILNNLVKLIKR